MTGEFNPQNYSAKFNSTQIQLDDLEKTTFPDLQEMAKQLQRICSYSKDNLFKIVFQIIRDSEIIHIFIN